MWKWIENRWERSLSRTQCSPSIVIFLVVAIVAAAVIKWANAILRTIEITVVSVVGLLALAGLGLIAREVFTWNRDRNREQAIRMVTHETKAMENTAMPVPDSVTPVADTLVNEAEAFLAKEATK